MNLAISILTNASNSARAQATQFVKLGIGSAGVSGGKLRFISGSGLGKGLLKVMTQQAVGTAVSFAKSYASQQINNLVKKLKLSTSTSTSNFKTKSNLYKKNQDDILSQKIANIEYGVMSYKATSKVSGRTFDDAVIEARDQYGHPCYEALMLGIPVSPQISLTVKSYKINGQEMVSEVMADKLIWYDCTAIINFSSERNVVLTKVVGRDYSRKELISNGDIEFTVNGHILSSVADVYPANEVKRFIEIMQYKGLVEVNNYLLDQFNIKKILIKNFNMTPKEATKNQQDYSFTAVGIQPESEVILAEDTISIIDETLAQTTTTEDNVWIKFLKNQYNGLLDNAADILDTGINQAGAVSSNYINSLI